MVFTSETIQNLKKSLSSGPNNVLSLKPFKVSKQMSTNKLIFDITFFRQSNHRLNGRSGTV